MNDFDFTFVNKVAQTGNVEPRPLSELPTKEQLLKVRHKKGSWGELLQSCLVHGLEKVLASVEAVYRSTQNAEANAWSDPSTYGIARKFQALCIKQATTIGNLKQLKTEEDVIRRLAVDYKPAKRDTKKTPAHNG